MRATRTKAMMFVGALLLAMTLVLPAAAAPAQHIQDGGCFDFGDGVGYCYSVDYLYQTTTTRSGVTKETYKGTSSYSLTYNGEVLYSGTDQFSGTFVSKQGEPQVYRQLGSFSYTYFGEACTGTYNVIFANGEVWHEKVSSSCV